MKLKYKIYTAPNNFQTLHLMWKETIHKAAYVHLNQRRLDAHSPGSTSMPNVDDMPDTWHYHHALWWQRGERWRMDKLSSGSYHRYLHFDDVIWYFRREIHHEIDNNWTSVALNTPDVKVSRRKPEPRIAHLTHNTPSPLNALPVDPTVVLAIYDLTPVDETTYLGRRAIVVEATYRRNWHCANLSKEAEWVHADRYRLLVDAERGFLLRHAALLDGEEAVVTEVTALRVDAPLDDAIFVLPPAAESA